MIETMDWSPYQVREHTEKRTLITRPIPPKEWFFMRGFHVLGVAVFLAFLVPELISAGKMNVASIWTGLFMCTFLIGMGAFLGSSLELAPVRVCLLDDRLEIRSLSSFFGWRRKTILYRSVASVVWDYPRMEDDTRARIKFAVSAMVDEAKIPLFLFFVPNPDPENEEAFAKARWIAERMGKELTEPQAPFFGE